MSADIWTESYLQDLSDDDIKLFQDIVLKDVKNKSIDDFEKTVLTNNLDLWLYSLRIVRREIELQLSQHKTNLKIKIQEINQKGSPKEELESLIIVEESWRNNAMKFLTSIERKTLYVKLLINQDKE